MTSWRMYNVVLGRNGDS